MEPYLRTWCEVDLKAIRQNMLNIRKKAGKDIKVMAVIKADGYGPVSYTHLTLPTIA